MRGPIDRTLILTAVALGLAAGLSAGFFLLGRATADIAHARAQGYQSGHNDGYFEGLRAGQAQGQQIGRALQATSTVAPDSQQVARDAFDRGYTAGESDAFGSFDGGWQTGSPYVVTVERSSGASIYQIANRTLVMPDVNYYLCADQHKMCSSPRH